MIRTRDNFFDCSTTYILSDFEVCLSTNSTVRYRSVGKRPEPLIKVHPVIQYLENPDTHRYSIKRAQYNTIDSTI